MGHTPPSHPPALGAVATYRPCRWLRGRRPSRPTGWPVTGRRTHNRCGNHSRRCTSSCTRCAASAGASGRWRTRAPPTARSGTRRRRPLPGRCPPRSRATCSSRRDTSCRRCAAPARSNRSRSSTRRQSRADRRRARRRCRGRHAAGPAHRAAARTEVSCGAETKRARTMAGLRRRVRSGRGPVLRGSSSSVSHEKVQPSSGVSSAPGAAAGDR